MTDTQNDTGLYDPDKHTIAEVTEHLKTADADEHARVLEAEKAGQNRAGIAALARPMPAVAEQAPLSVKKALVAINDTVADQLADEEDLADTVATLQTALFRFGAQDPSKELARSWQRVQRRLGVDPDKLDGIATAEQLAQFADRAGLTTTK